MIKIWIPKVSLLTFITLIAVSLGTGGVMSADVEVDMDGVLSLVGRHTVGHACPVEPYMALTAAHVIDLQWTDRNAPLHPQKYQNDKGDAGIAMPRGVLMYEDLGFLETSHEGHYVISEGTPSIGDKVFWVEYEIEDKGKAFQNKRREARILNILAGTIFTTEPPKPGASGGCLFNEKGEVIGIVNAGWSIRNYRGGDVNVGEAVGVYGPWKPKIPKPALREKDAS